MEHRKLQEILNSVIDFAKSNNQVLAVGLCGSRARGTARLDSDIDLSILVKDKLRFKTSDWIENFDFGKINEKLAYYKDEIYGSVWSRHVFLESKVEIEFSFADRSWADINKLDDGTRKVVSDGFEILYDPQKILSKLVKKVSNLPK